MNLEEIKSIINEFLEEEFEIEKEQLTNEARLKEDLRIDSLDFVDIAVEVEKQFKFKVTSDEMRGITTLGEFYKMIYDKLSK